MHKYSLIIFILVIFFCSENTFAQDEVLDYFPDKDGAVRNWLLLGPFSNSQNSRINILEHGEDCYGYHTDLLSEQGGEKAIMPYAGQIFKRQWTWKILFNTSEWIDFNSYYEKNDDAVAYAFIILHAENDMQIKFGLSHNDGLKIFLNGGQIYEEHMAQVVLNSVPLLADLKKGNNRLLLKVDEKTGGWGFGLSVKTPDDKELKGLKVKIPVREDPAALRAILFENAHVNDCEPAGDTPLSLNFPATGIFLPYAVELPLLLVDNQMNVISRQRLTTGRKLLQTYPLTFKPQGKTVNLILEGYPHLRPLVLHPVDKKVFNQDTDQHIGKRPYEMGERPGANNPLINFEDLQRWWIHSYNGASARLYRSRVQQMDGGYVARVEYAGVDGKSAFECGPQKPVLIPEEADNMGLWIYGNNWGWSPDPATPPVGVQIILVNGNGVEHPVFLGDVNWKEWFLKCRHFNHSDGALYFKSIRITGCANKENRQLFFDSLNFEREVWEPLNLKPLPDLLPLLTTEETLLPVPEDSVHVSGGLKGDQFVAGFTQNTHTVTYRYTPQKGTLQDFHIESDTGQKIIPFINGDIEFAFQPQNENAHLQERELERIENKDGMIVYHWIYKTDHLRIPYSISIAQRYNSLIIDISVQSENAGGLNLGHLKSNRPSKLIRVPMLTYGVPDPQVVCSGDLFIFALLDHYYTHASNLFAQNTILSETEVIFNGGSRYIQKTDGHRNPLRERLILSVSSNFHDILPTIPHQPSPMGEITRSRLWKENWGMSPDNETYERFYQGLRVLRSYGVSQFIVRHHEETWRDGGESFTLRLRAAPQKGGDQALIDYVRRIKALGYICGLYNNYVDFAPVNENWSPDRVARYSNKDYINAWPRCYTLKPYFAWLFESEYSPKIHKKFGSNTVYCDVHTALIPWARVDFDDRVPEAGMLRGSHKAYSVLLNNEKRAYEGPVFSEGQYQWFYAGLTDGNYGQIRDSEPDKVIPLVDFDLMRIHPLEVDIGMGNPGMFYQGGIEAAQLHSRSLIFDHFISTTIAYGHNGYLIDLPVIKNLDEMTASSRWGIPAILKSYYMMQQLQSRYALVKPEVISYFDGKEWLNTSEAIKNDGYKRAQIKTIYPNGLTTIVNLNEAEFLTVDIGNRPLVLPPNSYAAEGEKFFEMSAMLNGHRVDLVDSPAYLYADGRGELLKTDKILLTNSAVILKDSNEVWLIPIDENEQVAFLLSCMGLNSDVRVSGCDRNGEIMEDNVDFTSRDGWLTVGLSEKFFKYKIVNDD